jgi:drug/metabolite transporter (DMT)-like permease
LLLISIGNLLLFGFKHVDVNIGTVILSTEIIFALILGFVFYDEVPVAHEIIGGMFIFAASILSSVDVKSLRFRRKALV